jgi:hypothetical protein
MCRLVFIVCIVGALGSDEAGEAIAAVAAADAVVNAEQSKTETPAEKEAVAASDAVGVALKMTEPSLPSNTVIDAKKAAEESFQKSTEEKLPTASAAVAAATSAEAVVSAETKIPVSPVSEKIAERAAVAAVDGVAAHPQDSASAVIVATKEAAHGSTNSSDLTMLADAAVEVTSVAKHQFAKSGFVPICFVLFLVIGAVLRKAYKESVYVSPYMKVLFDSRQQKDDISFESEFLELTA